jgi:hypothetical protein
MKEAICTKAKQQSLATTHKNTKQQEGASTRKGLLCGRSIISNSGRKARFY